MAEMMEEFDFEAEEVLVIHPDEDTRKIEAIETDSNSNLEPASDFDVIQIETIETDTNSNLNQGADSNFKKLETIETDTNCNSGPASDSDIREIEVIETRATSDLEQVLDSGSDSGEIDDDEEVNDLEEGEIKDSSSVSKKRSEIACRFFKRGSCAFGSQCQYLHVSDTVYKMFDTNTQKKNNLPLVELHNFPKPLIFPPVLPPRPFMEPPILVVPKADFHRESDTFEDTWERGLEQARILIRKSNSKKKNEESEPKSVDSNNKDAKNKGSNFSKAGLGNEQELNNKKHCDKNSSYNSFRKENMNEEKRSYRYQPNSCDKWVDPWRRSKSPGGRKRLRSLSVSPPSRSRKHSSPSSTSSISSSSSEFDDIYRRPYVKKSPKGQQTFKSRSRSISQSRRSKKRRMSPKYSFNGRNRRSYSRSPSISYRKQANSSRVQSRSSSSSSSCSDCLKSVDAQDKQMKKISAKLDLQISRKSPKRASESFDSDCETSEMTVSSASCTSFSSDSETESPNYSSLKGRMSPKRNNSSSYSNKTRYLSNTKDFNKSRSNLPRNQGMVQHKNDFDPAYQRKIPPSDNRKNRNNWGFKNPPTDCKPKNTASYLNSVKKPTSASKSSEKKMPYDGELLSAYQKETQASSNLKNFNHRDIKPTPTDCKPKNTTSYFSSVMKPTSAPKGNKMCSDMELLSAYQSKTPTSDSRKNPGNYSTKTEPADCKPHLVKNTVSTTQSKNTTSCLSSVKKPASAPKVSKNKLSRDMELLFMYQGLGSANRSSSNVQKAKSDNSTSKPNGTKDAVNISDKANGNPQSYCSESNNSNVPKKDIVLNLQPKCRDYFNPELFNKPRDSDGMPAIMKETASKREQLITKLKLIDDAIARKKGK